MVNVNLKVSIEGVLKSKKVRLRRQPQDKPLLAAVLVRNVTIPFEPTQGMKFTCSGIHFYLYGHAQYGDKEIMWTGLTAKKFSNQFEHPLEREVKVFEKSLLDEGWKYDAD